MSVDAIPYLFVSFLLRDLRDFPLKFFSLDPVKERLVKKLCKKKDEAVQDTFHSTSEDYWKQGVQLSSGNIQLDVKHTVVLDYIAYYKLSFFYIFL